MTMTPQQEAIQRSAERLLSDLDAYVPSTTIHYAVEDARRALRTLIRENGTTPIITKDYVAARDASLGVGHIWTNVQCPAYESLQPRDCTCKEKQ